MNHKIAILLLLFACQPDKIIINDEDDINYGEMGKRKDTWVYDEQIASIQPGKTTVGEVYQILGKDISIRISFNPTLPKMYRKGKYRPVDKIIMYSAGDTEVSKDDGGITYRTKKVKNLVLYIFKGVVQFYSIGIRNNNELWEVDSASTTDIKEYGTSDWPYVSCDRKYYETKILHWDPKKHPWHFIPKEKETCYWEEPDFEKKLKRSGYYELLEDPHYGAKLECCK
jgi:hypothetical protein